jgi:hypothetical protein
MTVYVDDMRAAYGRLVMCHMIADSEAELIAMADRIGVRRKWHQHPGTPRSHFDICLTKRALAVQAGAVEITWRQTALMCRARRFTMQLCKPEEAEQWANITAARQGWNGAI